jgi:peptide/nickel transport system substrate-binding protein
MQRLKKIFLAFTRKERAFFLFAAAVAVISFIVVMSILVAETTRLVPAAGGTYTEGMVGQPEYVNPVTAVSETDLSLVKMIYSNIADVADSVTVSPDGRTWDVRLKDGLHWQDGEKLTSDDVIFTVQSIQDPDAGSPLYQSWQGVAVSRVSELELQFSLINPYAFFADNLKNLYILPKHLFANTPPGNWHLSDYDLKPVGSGPYEFVSYDKQSDGTITDYHLQAWSDYGGSKPLIARFNFAFFSNTADLVKSFNMGSVDGMGNLAASDLAQIARPYDLFPWRTSSYYAVFWNQSKSIPLEDPAVREALAAAVDRNALVTDILGGHGAPEYGPIPPGAPYFVPTPVTSSLDFASTTLTDAGWLVGADGTRAKMVQKTAVPLAVNLTVPNVDFLVKTAQEMAAAWEKLGVTANVSTADPQDLLNGSIKNRDYESLLFGNILGPSSDLYTFWDSSQRFSPGLNLAIYSNPKVDRFIEAARMELGDATRTAEFADAEQLIAADYPAAFLYSPDYLYVTDKSVQGITTGFLSDPSDRFREVGQWYLNTARVLK